MKGIQNTIPVTGMLNQSASNISYVPILQGILDGIGWKSPSGTIYEEQKFEVERYLSFQEVEQSYQQNPNSTNQKKLLSALDAKIDVAKAELRSARRHQKEAHDALMKKSPSTSMASRLSSWLMENVQYTFDSTPEQLIKRYSGIAKDRKVQIKKLSRYRNKITSENLMLSTDNKNFDYSQTQNISYPSSFDLSNLEKTMGFVTSVISSYSVWEFGKSVSNIGDINGDRIDDFVSVGITGNSETTVFVIFGSKNMGNNIYLHLGNITETTGFVFDAGATLYYGGVGVVSSSGDINADGLDDLLVSVPFSYENDFGRVYVIFGNNSIGTVGTLKFSDLNGKNGFLINGTPSHTAGVYSVSYAGDINADGLDDIVIGTWGRAWVIFGNKNIGSDGVLELPGLNGTNGFILNGDGSSVSYAGDINDDGIADLLIGGDECSTCYNAQVYVVFGKRDLGSNGAIILSSLNLNGTNGFIVKGFHDPANSCCRSPIQVSDAGDINGDGVDDFIMSNVFPVNFTGSTYVVFGHNNIGSGGILQVSNLNGTNGFKLNGVNPGDYSGVSISRAGDINCDGIDDLIIGAYFANFYRGVAYVIFGNYSVGSNGIIPLSSLNGCNGFALNGSHTTGSSDKIGYSVSNAGDINDDGIDDLLIGAEGFYTHPSNYGAFYVIFGGASLYPSPTPTPIYQRPYLLLPI